MAAHVAMVLSGARVVNRCGVKSLTALSSLSMSKSRGLLILGQPRTDFADYRSYRAKPKPYNAGWSQWPKRRDGKTGPCFPMDGPVMVLSCVACENSGRCCAVNALLVSSAAPGDIICSGLPRTRGVQMLAAYTSRSEPMLCRDRASPEGVMQCPLQPRWSRCRSGCDSQKVG